MSVYNGERYLHEAVESILNQTFSDFEFIIVDDASEDGAWRILTAYAEQDPRIVLIHNKENIGLTHSLNRGLAICRGKYIARQDADDVSLPERLATQIAFLDCHPHIVLLGTAIAWIKESGEPMGAIARHPCTDTGIRWKMLLNNAFWHSSVIVRRSVLVDHGVRYDTELQYAQDYDLWSRALAHGQGANLPMALVKLRFHKEQITRLAWDVQQDTADRVAFANFDRAGLGRHFSRTEIAMMRRLASPLGTRQRQAQVRSLLRLLKISSGKRGKPDPEWKAQRQAMLCQIRRYLASWPKDRATLQAQLQIMWADPVGTMVGVAGLFAGLGRKALARQASQRN